MMQNVPASRLKALICGVFLLSAGSMALAQGSEPKAGEKPKQPAKEDAAAAAKKIDEFAEAARLISGPAGDPECVWLGRRIVSLMWRDDLDTAFRHLDLYDRFGCPGAHIQSTFRCVVRHGNIDPKVPESLASRVNSCWIRPTGDGTDPEQKAAPAAAARANDASQPAAK
jgi:hypothetical protein